MPLTAKEKADRKFDRMFQKAREFRPASYLRKFVAPKFQEMVRAEAGAFVGQRLCVVDAELVYRFSRLGECVCVTCGKTGPWKGTGETGAAGGGFHTGHFIASRRASIVLEETNCSTQCSRCNLYESGNQSAFRVWMLHVHGREEIDRLIDLKNNVSRTFTHHELVTLRIGYMARTKRAVEVMSR